MCDDEAINIRYKKRLVTKEGILIPKTINYNDKIVWKIFDKKYYKIIDLA